MPYNNISELPESVKNVLPKPAQKLFMKVFNASFDKYGEDRAFKIAWAAVKKRFKKKGNIWVAKTTDFIKEIKYTYVFEAKEAFITKTDNDYAYIDYILSDNQPDITNEKFSDFALKSMANIISTDNPIKGRIDEDHSLVRNLLKSKGYTSDEIEQILKSLDTGIEAIYGKYNNGKLIATLKVKKDLLPLINRYKGASVEVRTPINEPIAGEYKNARLVGFVLTNNPANPRTGLAM